MIFVQRSEAPAVLIDPKGLGALETRKAIAFYRRRRGEPPKYAAYKHPTVRQALEELFSKKCAYCEHRYGGVHPVDVDHYRPKSGVLGQGGMRYPRGYYWLAATWENLLPSCIDCNRRRRQKDLSTGQLVTSGKNMWFPLTDETKRAKKPKAEQDEAPLLLDPCRDLPEQHIEFFSKADQSALLRPRMEDGQPNERGLKSIDIYGLNRSGLVQARREVRDQILATILDVQDALAMLDAATTETVRTRALGLLKRKLKAMDDFRQSCSVFSAMAKHEIDPVLENLKTKLQPYL